MLNRLLLITAFLIGAVLLVSPYAWAEGASITVDLGSGTRGQTAVVIQILALLTVLSSRSGALHHGDVIHAYRDRVVVSSTGVRDSSGAAQSGAHQAWPYF